MRKHTDICLLCKTNNSSQKNSHILPKFLTKDLFGENSSKMGFQLTSSTAFTKAPRKVQDSPKEDYILCPDCESYFGILEKLSRDTFVKWKNKIKDGSFIHHPMSNDFSIIECNSNDKRSVKLLIYSMYWRASISSNALFNNIRIEADFEEELRLTLLKYKSTKQNEYYKILLKKPVFKIFPMAIITAETFKDKTSNILHVPYYNGAYRLIVDQFSFLLFKNENDIPELFFKTHSNTLIEDCKIIVFSQNNWIESIIQPVFDLLSTLSLQRLNK